MVVKCTDSKDYLGLKLSPCKKEYYLSEGLKNPSANAGDVGSLVGELSAHLRQGNKATRCNQRGLQGLQPVLHNTRSPHATARGDRARHCAHAPQ